MEAQKGGLEDKHPFQFQVQIAVSFLGSRINESPKPSNFHLRTPGAIDEIRWFNTMFQSNAFEEHINVKLDMFTCLIYIQYQNKQRHLQGVKFDWYQLDITISLELEQRYVARYRSVRQNSRQRFRFCFRTSGQVACSMLCKVEHRTSCARLALSEKNPWPMIHVLYCTKEHNLPLDIRGHCGVDWRTVCIHTDIIYII